MAEYVVICEDGRQEKMNGGSMEEVMEILDKQGTVYQEIIPGSKGLNEIEMKKMQKDPIRFMAEGMPDAPPVNPFKGDVSIPIQVPGTPPPPQKKVEDVLFEENGVKFKISNGMLYKKEWQTLPDDECRIINKGNKKEYKGAQYEVQIQDWFDVVKIPNH